MITIHAVLTGAVGPALSGSVLRRRARTWGPGLGALGLVLAGCLSPSESVPDAPAGQGVAAVGQWTVSARTVAALAQQRAIAGPEAWRVLRPDVFLAHHYATSNRKSARAIEGVILAKSLLTTLRQQAAGAGPVADAELDELIATRFWEMARPRLVQVVHAVVLSDKPDDSARAVATSLREAAKDASSPQAFADAVASVDTRPWEVKVESLQPVAVDGRTVHPDNPPPAGPKVGHLVRPFAEAAHQLNEPGELSEVVRTDYGYHVLMMHKQWPAQRNTREQMRRHYLAEVIDRRTAALKQSLLGQLRKNNPPRVERSALQAMTQWPESL